MNIPKQTGMTLVELMVTLSIAAILASLAAPSVKAMLEKTRVRTMTNDFASSLFLARSEAVKIGFPVTICASNATRTDCDVNATDYSNGWIIFRDYSMDRSLTPATTLFDTDGNGLLDSPESIVFASDVPKPGFVLQNNFTTVQKVTYEPSGQARVGDGNGSMFSIIVNKADGSPVVLTPMARIIVSMTGRARSCIITSDEPCT